MEIIHGDQGTDEWHKLRLGSIGGSGISKVAVVGRGGGTSKVREKLKFELASEIVTGVPTENFKFHHADRGHEFEEDTWAYYQLVTGNSVEHVSLVKSVNPYFHYSPDSLINKNGIGEGKVRIPSVYAEAFDVGYFPTDVKRQIQWGLYICEREFCEHIQYCPEMANAGVTPAIIDTIYRDEKLINSLKEAADQFVVEMLKLVNRIKAS